MLDVHVPVKQSVHSTRLQIMSNSTCSLSQTTAERPGLPHSTSAVKGKGGISPPSQQ